MKTLKDICEGLLQGQDKTIKVGDDYDKIISKLYKGLQKYVKKPNIWVYKEKPHTDLVWFEFNLPLSDDVINIFCDQLSICYGNQKRKGMYLDVNVQYHPSSPNSVMCYIEVMNRDDIIVRIGTKKIFLNYNSASPKNDDIVTKIDNILKPAIKQVFEPTFKDIDSLINFIKTQND